MPEFFSDVTLSNGGPAVLVPGGPTFPALQSVVYLLPIAVDAHASCQVAMKGLASVPF